MLEILVNFGSSNESLPDGTKPLNEPTLTYYEFDPHQEISVKLESKSNDFHLRKWP